uniref:Uncharacterized protein n=1 Tax=Ditylenchus dipsaci TaxID=166011 RepID=A0A915CMN6_9BILA
MPDSTHSQAILKGLRARWEDLTSFVSEAVKEKWWDMICDKYSGRPFYNLDHLSEQMSLFDTFKDKLKDRYALAFAIIFKHLEYDPQSSGDNDTAAKNAQLLRDFCQETTFDQENYVANLLLESGNNCTDANLTQGEYGEEDVHFLIDFDMAWLGASELEYQKHKIAIRKEYSHLSESEYDEQRLKVLQFFLQVPNIYATRELRDKYEKKARENIQKEINCLLELKKTSKNTVTFKASPQTNLLHVL